MKYVISVGTGKNQIPILKKLQSKGYSIIGFDRDEEAVGRKYCVLFNAISTYDHQKAYIWLNELDVEFIGVVALTCSQAIYTQHYLIDKFNLKNGVPLRLVNSSLNKQAMLCLFKESLKSRKVITFDKEGIISQQLETDQYVLKCKNGLASEGIKKVNKKDLLTLNYDEEKFYIEPYYIGKERRAIIIIENDTIVFLEYICKENLESTFFTQKIYPLEIIDLEFERIILKFIKDIKLSNCILKVDFIIDSNNQIHILEVDFDPPGDYFETYFSAHILKVDYLEYYLNHYITNYMPILRYKKDSNYKSLNYLYSDQDNKEYTKADIHSCLKDKNDNYKLLEYKEDTFNKPKSNNDRIAVYLS